MAANLAVAQPDKTIYVQNRILHDKLSNERYMRRAIELAKNSSLEPFGAVLINDVGLIVGEGLNRVSENPILHGEIVAINNCAASHHNIAWKTLTLFTTAEPCAMCQSAIAWAGISGVVYGSSMPFLQKLKWQVIQIRASGIANRAQFRKCTIKGGVLERECNALFWAARNLNG